MKMTRDEIINEIKDILYELDNGEDAVSYLTQNDVEWLNENIKALEQETCEDTISREDAILALDEIFDSVPMDLTTEILKLRTTLRKKLPSVQPQPKMGHWIRQTDDYHDYYECDQCGIAVGLDDIKNYCPNCGAKNVPDPNDGKCSEIPKSLDLQESEE